MRDKILELIGVVETDELEDETLLYLLEMRMQRMKASIEELEDENRKIRGDLIQASRDYHKEIEKIRNNPESLYGKVSYFLDQSFPDKCALSRIYSVEFRAGNYKLTHLTKGIRYVAQQITQEEAELFQ